MAIMIFKYNLFIIDYKLELLKKKKIVICIHELIVKSRPLDDIKYIKEQSK